MVHLSGITLAGLLIIGILLIATSAININLSNRCSITSITAANAVSQQNVFNSKTFSIITLVIGLILVLMAAYFYFTQRSEVSATEKSTSPVATGTTKSATAPTSFTNNPVFGAKPSAAGINVVKPASATLAPTVAKPAATINHT